MGEGAETREERGEAEQQGIRWMGSFVLCQFKSPV